MAGEFLAKGGVKAPHVNIVPAVDGTVLDIKTPSNSDLLTVQGQNGTVDFFMGNMKTLSVSAINTPKTLSFYTHIAYLNDKLIVIERKPSSPATQILYHTTDGVTYTALNITANTSQVNARVSAYFKGKYIFAGYNYLIYSTDLTSYTLVPTFSSYDIYALLEVNGKLIAYTATDTIFFSTDGVNWSRTSSVNTPSPWLYGVGLLPNGKAYAVYNTEVHFTEDGTNYTKIGNTPGASRAVIQNSKKECFVLTNVGSNVTVQKTTDFITYSPIFTTSGSGAVYRGKTAGQYLAFNIIGQKHITSDDDGLTWKVDTTFPTKVLESVTSTGGSIIYQFDSVYDVRIKQTSTSEVKLPVMTLTNNAIVTQKEQSSLPNSLVRKDYVDEQIIDTVKIQTDTLKTSVANLETAVKGIQDSTLDYGEY